MRKRLIGVLLAGLVVAGCGSSGSAPEAGAPAPQPVDDAPKSDRKAPAKTTDIADKCSVLTQQQQQELGTTRPPEETESNGRQGCAYQHGKAGAPGWNAFIAVHDKSSFAKEVKRHSDLERSELVGYPIAKYEENTGCVLYADVADKGFMITNVGENSATRSGLDICQQAEKVTEMALQNIPNA